MQTRTRARIDRTANARVRTFAAQSRRVLTSSLLPLIGLVIFMWVRTNWLYLFTLPRIALASLAALIFFCGGLLAFMLARPREM